MSPLAMLMLLKIRFYVNKSNPLLFPPQNADVAENKVL